MPSYPTLGCMVSLPKVEAGGVPGEVSLPSFIPSVPRNHEEGRHGWTIC